MSASANQFVELPLFIKGEVVKGFNRGSKELGIPTANYSEEIVCSMPDLPLGVYMGWACVEYNNNNNNNNNKFNNDNNNNDNINDNIDNDKDNDKDNNNNNNNIDAAVYPMVLSLGYNPYYKNTLKSLETHIIHKYAEDFYGNVLKICITSYIREMKDFTSLQQLVDAIHSDINKAMECLENRDEFKHLKEQLTKF